MKSLTIVQSATSKYVVERGDGSFVSQHNDLHKAIESAGNESQGLGGQETFVRRDLDATSPI